EVKMAYRGTHRDSNSVGEEVRVFDDAENRQVCDNGRSVRPNHHRTSRSYYAGSLLATWPRVCDLWSCPTCRVGPNKQERRRPARIPSQPPPNGAGPELRQVQVAKVSR